MTIYYALVLVPGDTPAGDVTDEATARLQPFQADAQQPGQEAKFDYLAELEDYIDEHGQPTQPYIWPVRELPDFEDLAIEAVLTPDGRWYETNEGWDDPTWVQQAQHLFDENPEAIAVRYVLHIKDPGHSYDE